MPPRPTIFLLPFFFFGWTQSPADESVPRGFSIPLVDLSQETDKHVIVEPGTETVYQGHPTTVLLPDGKTILAVWTRDHGGPCGPMKKSTDGGLTWEDVDTPRQWREMRNCPSIYRLTDPQGTTRLVIYAKKQTPPGKNDSEIVRAVSEDDGETWSEMEGIGIVSVMPWCTVVPIDGGERLLAATNARRAGDPDPRSNNVIQSTSTDGGLSWSEPRIICDMPDYKPCEPFIFRSPDGGQLLCLMRENTRKLNALYMTSSDEGATWSEPRQLPGSLSGDRHQAKYAPDGRLVAVFRDTAVKSPTRTHFVGWVGTYDDIIEGREGQYRLKLLHSYKGGDCGYPGLELLPDGTFVATTYIKYWPDARKNSIISVRFQLAETDKVAGGRN